MKAPSSSSSSTTIVVPAPNPRAIYVADAVSRVSASAFVRGDATSFGRTPSTHRHTPHDYVTMWLLHTVQLCSIHAACVYRWGRGGGRGRVAGVLGCLDDRQKKTKSATKLYCIIIESLIKTILPSTQNTTPFFVFLPLPPPSQL